MRVPQDIVLFQGVWLAKDAQILLHSATHAGLVHGRHFESGNFGSGLVSISRYPITDSGFKQYSAAGDAAAPLCGDFYASKGVDIQADTCMSVMVGWFPLFSDVEASHDKGWTGHMTDDWLFCRGKWVDQKLWHPSLLPYQHSTSSFPTQMSRRNIGTSQNSANHLAWIQSSQDWSL